MNNFKLCERIQTYKKKGVDVIMYVNLVLYFKKSTKIQRELKITIRRLEST